MVPDFWNKAMSCVNGPATIHTVDMGTIHGCGEEKMAASVQGNNMPIFG